MSLIDLGAAIREKAGDPDGVKVRDLRGEEYVLPLELPIDVFDPLLSNELDLPGLLRDVLNQSGKDVSEAIVEIVLGRPDLPKKVVDAFHGCFELLFGVEQYQRFREGRPGMTTYSFLIRGLAREYGVGLGEAFGSPASSEPTGESSKETSPSTSDSTPETSSDAPANEPGSSESDGSATS